MNRKNTFFGRAALVAAVSIAACTGAQARTVALVENKVNGETVSFTATLSQDSPDVTNALWLVYGPRSSATTLSGWTGFRLVAMVPGDVTSVPDIPLPANWGSAAACVRFLISSDPRFIPGAKVLESITADGGQYIATSFVPSDTSAVEMTLAFTDSPEWQNLFCARDYNDSTGRFTLFRNGSNKWRWDFSDKQNSQSTSFDPGTTTHTLRASSAGVTIDGRNVTGVASETTVPFTARSTMTIFAAHGKDSSQVYPGYFTLYSFKAWADGSTLALDLVPCSKDGEVCLCDRVSGTFLTNQGSGSFVAGPEDDEINSATVAYSNVAVADNLDYVRDGLLAHWDGISNAGAGNPHDSSATSWIDLVSGIVASKLGDAAIGVESNRFHFTGTASRFEASIPTFSDAIAASGGFTIEYVASYKTASQNTCISAKMGIIGPSFQSGALRYITKAGGCDLMQVPTDTPCTAALSYDSNAELSTVRPYFNGVYYPDNTNVFWGGSYSPTSTAVIGNHNAGASGEGYIYAVRIYGRRLTHEEVAANYAKDKQRFAVGDGWVAASSSFYPYSYPLYVTEVSAGVSNSIDEVSFKQEDASGAVAPDDISYADFTAQSRSGTIVKRGGGTLTFNRDLSSFTGPVHVEDGVGIGVCSNCFGLTVYDDNGRETQRTYVHSGATLVMDDVNNKNYYHESNAAVYEGDGYPGLGGAFVMRNGDKNTGTEREIRSWWQPGARSTAVGPASVYLDIPSGSEVHIGLFSASKVNNSFDANGQDVLMYGRDAGSVLNLYMQAILNIGNLVISNMTLRLSEGAYLNTKYRRDGDPERTVRFKGGSRLDWRNYDYKNNGLAQYATLYIDDMEYAILYYSSSDTEVFGVNPWNSSGASFFWHHGPMVLNDDFRMYNIHATKYFGCTFTNEVSGVGGFRPWLDSNGVSHGGRLRLNLLCPTNTFQGGIVLDRGSLGVYGERAVPSQEGAGLVSITNGYVYFGRKVESASVTNDWVNFTMPVTEFVGNGAITNGTGVFQGLVKKGDGTLDYNSQMGGAYLDLQGGTVKINTQYRGAYTGDNAGAAPAGYAEALPSFTTLKGTAGTLDLNGAGGACTVANLEGTPSVANGSLTVTNAWTLDVATLGVNAVNVSGTLAFGPGAEINVAGDLGSLTGGKSIVLARAASVTGLPQFVGNGWAVLRNGGEVRLARPGFIISIR